MYRNNLNRSNMDLISNIVMIRDEVSKDASAVISVCAGFGKMLFTGIVSSVRIH